MQHIFGRFRVVLRVLEFDDHRAALQAPAGMVLPPGHMDGGSVAAGRQKPAPRFVPQPIEEQLLSPAPQHHHVLTRARVPMHGNLRPRLNGIEHALTLIIHGVTEVIVHPQAGRGFGLLCQIIEHFYSNNHSVNYYYR